MSMSVKVFYDPISAGFYQTDINKQIPPTSVEITDKHRWELLEQESKGAVITIVEGVPTTTFPPQESHSEERSWRNSELNVADIELNKVQDGDTKAVGAVSQWREYRKALRAWPEQKDFPSKDFRPKPPK